MLGGLTPLAMPFLTIADSTDFGGEAVTAFDGINASNAGVLLIQGMADETITPEKSAVTRFEDTFTNPNVQVIFCENEWDSGHEDIVYSKDAYFYREAVNKAYSEYITANGIEKPTANDRQAFWKDYGFDKKAAREVNGELLEIAETFIRQNIGF
jgi:hypothetical protein